MDNQDEQKFYIALSSCCEVIGKPKLSQAAAKLLFSKLSQYPLDWVIWGMTEATEQCDSGFDFTIKRIRKIIESKMQTSKFRREAELKIEQQRQASADQALYIESDEYKANKKATENCFKSIREELNKNV